jgi:hypothetical protein
MALPPPSVVPVLRGKEGLPLPVVTKEKVTVAPLTTAPVESVTVTVIILLRPPSRDVGEAVIDDICRVVLVPPSPLSVLPPQAIRQQNRNMEIIIHDDFKKVDFVMLLSFLKRK